MRPLFIINTIIALFVSLILPILILAKVPYSVFYKQGPIITSLESLQSLNEAYFNDICPLDKNISSPIFNTLTPKVCAIITTTSRTLNASSYIKSTIGSILKKITQEDKDQIELIVFNVNQPPLNHIAITQVKKCVTVIEPSTDQKIKNIYIKETVHYTEALKFCSQRAPYTLLLEDDLVIGKHGFKPIWDFLDSIDDQDWLYLRAFNSEAFMGYQFLFIQEFIVLLLFIFCVSFIVLRFVFNRQIRLRLVISVVMVLYFGILIGLMGRQALNGVYKQNGIVREEPMSCCTQSLLFQSNRVDDLVDYLLEKSLRPPARYATDLLIDDYKNSNGMYSYTIYPSVFQHVGIVSSLTDKPKKILVYSQSFELSNKEI